jgi:Tol biopolymer transport system component
VRRRVISFGSVLVAVVALVLVLYNATLVDRRAPGVAKVYLSATAPGNPALAQTLTAIDLEFSEPVKQGSVERRFRTVPPIAGTMSWNGTTAIFTPSTKLPLNQDFKVYVDQGFEDLAGNVATVGLDGWAFRTVGPPTLVETQPADGAERIGVDTKLTVTFDRLMDPGAVEAAIRIQPAAQFHAAWSGQILTLSFDTQLLFGTTYTVTIEPSASDVDGTRLARPQSVRFTTVAADLGVSTTIPADGVAGISVRGPIVIGFDGPIDPASVANALSITPAVQGDARVIDVPSDASPAPTAGPSPAPGSVLVFQPSGTLAPHTTYSVTLRPVVTRPGSPGQVAAGQTWSFTTGQPTTSAQNQVAFLSARGGVRNVWLMNPDGSNPRQLTTDLSPVAGFDVTGDGSRVAWSAGGVVNVMQMDGTNQQTITAPGQHEYAPRFTPDGRALLVGRRDASGADLGFWLIPLDGGDPSQVLASGAPPLGSSLLEGDGSSAGEGSPVWAPRAAFDPVGRHLALTTGSGEVWVVDLTAAAPAAVAEDTGIVAQDGPVWSSFANRFVVIGREGQEPRDSLWTVGTDGATLRRASADGSVAVTPEGSVAYLVRGFGAATHVGVARMTNPASVRSLTTGVDIWDRWPTFSPDGKVILFGRVPGSNADVSAGIWTVDVATGAITALTTDGAYPRWLP